MTEKKLTYMTIPLTTNYHAFFIAPQRENYSNSIRMTFLNGQ